MAADSTYHVPPNAVPAITMLVVSWSWALAVCVPAQAAVATTTISIHRPISWTPMFALLGSTAQSFPRTAFSALAEVESILDLVRLGQIHDLPNCVKVQHSVKHMLAGPTLLNLAKHILHRLGSRI